jgi:S-formylglutathione hydrolase
VTISLIKENKTFDGFTKYFEHDSKITKTKMKFSVFLPKEKVENCIVWLSGLTCNEENFITKAGAQKYLAGSNTMIICPDTSPRGLDLKGEHESYDFGSSAGFYLNATTAEYSEYYQMYDYITVELIDILKDQFSITNFSICGHSMGGHGALTIGLREKELFQCVSAFSPIVNPMKCAFGQKAFRGYLGDDEAKWKLYDATQLILDSNLRSDTLLLDQGTADEFLQKELLTPNFANACEKMCQKVNIKYREGYDHSYFYISTFIGEHIKFHLDAFTCHDRN